MVKIRQKRPRLTPVSKDPYVRRNEAEMTKIIGEIKTGILTIRGACFKYGLCRNTLKLWITRASVRNLESVMSKKSIKHMQQDLDSKALQRKIHELTRALEHAKLKINSLETLIKVSEDDLQIKIRKKPGTKQSKE
ncbi:MAG: hypothetical protein EYC69_10805 [Bacteroidetes bacterium]|nr:MAG: hypothetical protein EYC69_10805 [Bacteroidota bacterium]